jgi:hypothetical protein
MIAGHDERDEARLEGLIERSSLGALGARQLRERIPAAEAKDIVRMADELHAPAREVRPKSGEASDDSRIPPSTGAEKAIITLARRSNIRTLIRALDVTTTLAHEIANEIDGALVRDLIHDLLGALDLAFDRFSNLVGDLDVDLDPARVRTLDLYVDLTRAREITRIDALEIIRVRAREIGASLSRRRNSLVHQFNKMTVDASGIDLSSLRITDISALEKVLWTHDTTWPQGVREQVRSRSHEIRPGVYEVRNDS